MIKTPISLQDLRRSVYVKAKAESTWRFWGLYVHVCKMETLSEAYQMAKKNNGLQEWMESRSKPSKKPEWKCFYSRYRTNLSPTRIGPQRFGERRSLRTEAIKSVPSRFH